MPCERKASPTCSGSHKEGDYRSASEGAGGGRGGLPAPLAVRVRGCEPVWDVCESERAANALWNKSVRREVTMQSGHARTSPSARAPNDGNKGNGGPLAPGSKLLGLKFMQRQQQSSATAATPSPGAASTNSGATPAALHSASQPSAVEWKLESITTARGGANVVMEDETALEEDMTSALLHFRAGRRSFGSFNPRLEKRLGEISSTQRAAREAAAESARAVEAKRKRDAEHAALVREADAAEAIEKQNSVSDAEMASAFAGRYAAAGGPSAKRQKQQNKKR